MQKVGRPVYILGAGLTGLSAALHLERRPYRLIERDGRVGGKARSERRDGFTFDVTGHWLHLRNNRVKALVQRLFAPDDLVTIERKTGIYTHGKMLPYPFQANLHGLPLEVLRECLLGFVQARIAAAGSVLPTPSTFTEFVEQRFGSGMAKHFFIPYNTKLWGVHPDALTASWVSRFVPLPDVEQVISGALGVVQEGLGYNASFLYPASGGIDALPEAMLRELGPTPPLQLGTELAALEASSQRLRLTTNAEWESYEAIISTLPLPDLVARITDAPPEVRDAARCLRAVPWRYLDIACRTQPRIEEHWVYVPEPHIPCFRVGIYSNASPAMAPPGCSSLYVELTDREGPVPWDALCSNLVDMGAITNEKDVVFVREHQVPQAYVVFDEHHERATATIHAWLQTVGIRSCGRYGEWTYNSMEDSIIAGMEAAAWAAR